MYHALVEARVPFEMVHEALLTPERLDRFKLLILADAAALSDAQCAAIRRLRRARRQRARDVRDLALRRARAAGGTDFGLADVFGVSFAGRIDGPMQNSYLSLDADPATGQRHAVLAGLEDTPRIINGVFRLQVTPTSRLSIAGHADPDVPGSADGGRLSARSRTPTSASSICGRWAPARVAYVPWDIDRTFWDVMCVDHGRLLRNLVAWTTNEPPPVEVTGPGLVDVTVWRQRESMTVHLVNLTNPMMMKGPLREVIPIGPLKVRIRLPEGLAPATGSAADRRQRRHACETVSRAMTVTVPSVDVHEVDRDRLVVRSSFQLPASARDSTG